MSKYCDNVSGIQRAVTQCFLSRGNCLIQY